MTKPGQPAGNMRLDLDDEAADNQLSPTPWVLRDSQHAPQVRCARRRSPP